MISLPLIHMSCVLKERHMWRKGAQVSQEARRKATLVRGEGEQDTRGTRLSSESLQRIRKQMFMSTNQDLSSHTENSRAKAKMRALKRVFVFWKLWETKRLYILVQGYPKLPTQTSKWGLSSPTVMAYLDYQLDTPGKRKDWPVQVRQWPYLWAKFWLWMDNGCIWT